MGLNVAKCTIPFEQGAYGWTETYFLANPSTTLAAEMTQLQALAVKRIALSGKDTYIRYLKVSNENTLRDVIAFQYGYPGGGALQGNTSTDSEPPDTALLCDRKSSTNVQTAPLYLRGVWDRLCINGGQFIFGDPAWVAAFNSFKFQLTTNAWGMVCKDPTAPARVQVASVTQTLTGTIAYTLKANLFTDPAGTKIRIFASGIQGAVSANGAQIVTVTSPTACETVKRIPTFLYTTGGYVTWSPQAFTLIANLYQLRLVERKAGRPLYLSRGRARVRKVS